MADINHRNVWLLRPERRGRSCSHIRCDFCYGRGVVALLLRSCSLLAGFSGSEDIIASGNAAALERPSARVRACVRVCA